MDERPLIDWDLGTKLAGNKKELAEELLGLLVKNLQEEIPAINKLDQTLDHAELLRRIHRLHGAVSYCGIPRVKSCLNELERALKNHKEELLPALFYDLNEEIQALFDCYNALPRK